MIYTTVQGDTWDLIAKKVYGDETLADFLMASNYELLDILVFSAGVVVKTPAKIVRRGNELPPWRR